MYTQYCSNVVVGTKCLRHSRPTLPKRPTRPKINEREMKKKCQRFSKIKRAASPRSKPTQCSTFAVAPHTQAHPPP